MVHIIALYIIGGLFLLLCILLILPVKLRFSYAGEKLDIRVRYLFLHLNLSPDALAAKAEKKRPKKPQKDKPPKKKKKQEEPESKKKLGKKFSPQSLETVMELLRSAGGAWNYLRRHIVFYRVKLYIVICGGDAHQTAVNHGRYSALIFGGLALLGEVFTVNNAVVFLYPDFTGQKSRYDISWRLRVRPVTALFAGISLLFKFLKLKAKNKSKIKSKGGIKHESVSVGK